MSMSVALPRSTWCDPTTGEALDGPQLIRSLADRQAVLLGEIHDIAEIHRWQAHVIAALHQVQPRLAVGFEMFPRRVQPILDLWVEGTLSTREFLCRSDWDRVWGFSADLYLPIFHLCRQQRIPMLALNCERTLVSRVGRDGWDAIPDDERDGVTPAAAATVQYRQHLWDITGGNAARGSGARSPDDPAFDRFVRAQQTWDRAFACRIADALRAGLADLVVGIIGRGHCDYFGGTPHQLADLGVSAVAVLAPHLDSTLTLETERRLADAVFRLDQPEPPAPRRHRARLVAG